LVFTQTLKPSVNPISVAWLKPCPSFRDFSQPGKRSLQRLAEKILHLAQQTPRGGLVLDMHGLAELAKQIALHF